MVQRVARADRNARPGDQDQARAGVSQAIFRTAGVSAGNGVWLRRFRPEAVRKDDFSALCAELRQQFDVIIVDTGVMPVSIEVLPIVESAGRLSR